MIKSDRSPSFRRFVESKPVLLFLGLFDGTRRLIRRMYNWVISWAEKPQAEKALGGVAFAESSFFPIPPDPLLIAMVISRPHKWIRLALITTGLSVIGGMFGYLIGAGLQETVGRWIIDTYHLQEQFITVGNLYAEYTVLAVIIAGFSPIPYKLFTIAAGVFGVNIPLFLLASTIGRGGRFFLVSFLMHHFGKRFKDKIEKYVDLLSIAFVALIVLGFLAIQYIG